MPNINITVAEKIATNTTPGEIIVCSNSDYTVTFDLDAEWNAEPNRTARFVYCKDGLRQYKDVPFSNNPVAVPVLSGIDYVEVGVYAGDLHTTTPAKVLCDRSILCGDAVEQITQEEKVGLVAKMGDLAALETKDKSSLVAAINEVAKSGGSGSVSEDQIAAAVEEYFTKNPVSGGSAVRVAEVELLAANWAGAASPYSQVVSIPSVTQYSQVDLTPSVEQLAIFHDKDLAFVTENEDGVVTVYAIGDKPLNDYTMQVTIKEVSV